MEQRIATGRFHGEWMGPSGAKEQFAFAKLIVNGKYGARGIKMLDDRVVTKKDVKNLIKNGRRGLTKEIKEAVIRAHSKRIRDLFKEPTTDNDHFKYPFYLKNEKFDMNLEDQLLAKFHNALNCVPSKARFEGFHLAILGRFNPCWRNIVWRIIKLILLTRYMPSRFKSIARIPIPKPNKTEEFRPLSLCHDIYCYINDIMATFTSEAVEKANILHEGITAYRKGRGCAMLVCSELGLREDTIESNKPTACFQEDDENFLIGYVLKFVLLH